MRTKKFGFSKVGVLGVVVVLIGLGFLVWRTTHKPTPVSVPLRYEDTDPTFVPVDWPMFYNPEFKFTIMYPTGYVASGSTYPLEITPVVAPNQPAPAPVLVAIARTGNLESAIEYLRDLYVVMEIERLPYTRYVKVIASEKERPDVRTEYFIRSNGKVSYVLFGWEGVDWKYTGNVASSLEFEE